MKGKISGGESMQRFIHMAVSQQAERARRETGIRINYQGPPQVTHSSRQTPLPRGSRALQVVDTMFKVGVSGGHFQFQT